MAAALKRDAVLAPFFDPAFDAEAYVRSVVRGDAASGSTTTAGLDESASEVSLARVRARLALVDHSLKELVAQHQTELFSQAGTSATLKRSVAGVTARVDALAGAATRWRADVLQPLSALKTETRTLANVLAASELLRRVQRVHFNLRRLRGAVGAAQSGGTTTAAPVAPEKLADVRSLARIAPLLYDVEAGLADPAVAGVDLIEAERDAVAAMGVAVRGGARAILTRAVDSLNAVDVAASLQVFHDLRCAPAEVILAIDRAADAAAAAFRDAVDVRAVAAAAQLAIEGGGAGGGSGVGMSLAAGGVLPGAASRAWGGSSASASAPAVPPAGAAAAWRGALWGRVETAAEALSRTTLQAWNLTYVAARLPRGEGAAGGPGGGRHGATLLSALREALASLPVAAVSPGAEPGDAAAAAAATGAQASPAVGLLSRFWRCATSGFGGVCSAIASGGDSTVFARGTLGEGYPRLHYLLLDALARAGRSVALRATDEAADRAGAFGSIGGGGDGGESVAPVSGTRLFALSCSTRALVAAASPLLHLYLERSAARLSEPVTAMFPTSGGRAVARRPQQRAALRAPPPSSAAAARARGFTPPDEWERLADEPQPEAPSLASTAALVKALGAELAACRPSAASAAARGGSSGAGDAALFAAVAKGVASAAKLVAARIENMAAPPTGAAATAVGEHFVPTPAQALNLALALRADEIRRALLRSASEPGLLPLPVPLEALLGVGPDDPVVRAAAARLAAASPLRHALPPGLIAVRHLAAAASGTPEALLAAATAHASLAAGIGALDAVIDSLLLPWLSAIAEPLERAVSRLHDGAYTATPAAAEGKAEATAQPAETSEYVASLEAAAEALSTHQLALLPAGAVADAVRAALARRVLTLFVRHAALVRPMDESGRLRLARDGAAVEAALSHLVSDVARLGRSYAELRAFRPLLFTTSAELLGALRFAEGSSAEAKAGGGGGADAAAARRGKVVTLLRTLRPVNTLHALLSRLPPTACPLPFERAAQRVPLVAYIRELDEIAMTAAGAGAWAADGDGSDSAGPMLVPAGSGGGSPARLFLPQSALAAVDAAVLARARACVDEYVQRAALSSATAGAEYDLIVHHGDALIALGSGAAPSAHRTS